ncbi:MAG: hypothetical protein ACSHXL_06905 [Bacteroidota bacterium]
MEEHLLLTYCNYHPDFLARIANFPEKDRVLKMLKASKNRLQFLSTISEFTFGEVFHQLGFEIIYEKQYSNSQTPDWTLCNNNENAICEIYRLGKSDKDQKRSDFENDLIERLQQLIYPCAIRISYNEQYFNFSESDIDYLVAEVNSWLSSTVRKVGEGLLLLDFFSFEIIEFKQQLDYVCCVGNSSTIDYKSQKLIQYEGLKKLNEITKKLTKYNSIIQDYELPYFIGVDIDFISGFDFEDFVAYFRGSGVVNADYGKVFPGAEEMNQYGEEWTQIGVFKDNPQLSGFILRYNNEFKILLNPSNSQIIYKSKEILRKLNSISKL